jgi:hypothetical protein
LGEFAPEDIPAKETLTRFANWTAPELMDHEAFWKIRVDNYRDHDYRGEYKLESDIFAMGCTALEVCLAFFCRYRARHFIFIFHFPDRYTQERHQHP